MARYKYILIVLWALTIAACSKTELEESSDGYIDDSYGSQTLLTESNSDSKELTLLLGLAADGVSSIDLLIPVRKSYSNPTITIEAKSEDWGVIELVGKSDFESLNFYFYRYTFTSEERLPESLENSSVAELIYSIEVGDEEGNAMAVPITISVIRPAVIFAHGLASNAETYTPMLNYIRPMGLYLDEALYAVDYFKTSVASYATNLNVIPEAIEQTRSTLYDLGYVNEKFTIVGHSMGGILTRLYIQNESEEYPYNDDILKIITIDTPHSGSQLADFALSLGDGDTTSPLTIFSKMGAIVDLAVESDATKNLNDSAKLSAANALEIPTHVITAHIGTTWDVAQLINEEQYLFAVTTYLINALEQKYIYGDDQNDIIVPMTSQLGGVEDRWRTSYITTYSNEWHCSVHTTEVAATDIVGLFNTVSSDDSVFTTSGFSPATLSYASDAEIEMVEVSSTPDMAEVDTQLLIGVNADGEVVTAAYDDEANPSFALSDEQMSGVVIRYYIAKLKSGEFNYTTTTLVE